MMARNRPRRLAAIPALAACAVALATAFAPDAAARGKVEMEIEGDPVIRVLRQDGIPAIDDPDMITVEEAALVMRDDEPVIAVFDGENARAYSTWFLDGHEIVNDRLGDVPIAATW